MKEILETKKYDLFKRLKGNREVSRYRIQQIRDSIEKVGYVTSPIIVNEHMEVIDGQGRLEALRELKLPVEYIIHKGIGVKECISMNLKNTSWNLSDFIKSYAERGNENYVRLQKLLDNGNYGAMVTATALFKIGRLDTNIVKNGNLIVTEEDYNNAKNDLKWLDTIKPYIKMTTKKYRVLFQSLLICKEIASLDINKLKERVIEQYTVMLPYTNIADCMKSLEELYNKGRRAENTVYIYTEYRKYIALRDIPNATKRIEKYNEEKRSKQI